MFHAEPGDGEVGGGRARIAFSWRAVSFFCTVLALAVERSSGAANTAYRIFAGRAGEQRIGTTTA